MFITSLLLFVFDLSPEGKQSNYEVKVPASEDIQLPSMAQVDASIEKGWGDVKSDIHKVF